MRYSFKINKYKDPLTGLEVTNPLVVIDEQEKYGWFFLDEIQNLSLNLPYLKEVSEKLESLRLGKISHYEGFGSEVYMIECDSNEAIVKNLSEGGKIEARISFDDVYFLIKGWYNYVLEFEEARSPNSDLKRKRAKIAKQKSIIKGTEYMPRADKAESFIFKEIEVFKNILNNDIYANSIEEEELIISLDIGNDRVLEFDMAASIHQRTWPEKLSSLKQIKKIRGLLEAELMFTKKGTYSLRKDSERHKLNTLYLALGKLNGKECLVSFYHDEKQPTLYLSYLDMVIELEPDLLG